MLNELIGSVVQVLLFALVPLIFWYITSRKETFDKYSFSLRRP